MVNAGGDKKAALDLLNEAKAVVPPLRNRLPS